MKRQGPSYIRLTSHPSLYPKALPINWGSRDLNLRGPIIATTSNPSQRNVIGTHSGSYSVYRALGIAAGRLNAEHRADLRLTSPIVDINPVDSWFGDAIVSLDPFGHLTSSSFSAHIDKGFDIRPTIAVTKAQIQVPELLLPQQQRLNRDGRILKADGGAAVTKIAVEPVWYLPGVAKRFNIAEEDLRKILFEQTAGMFPELVTRFDFKVFLPPIGGLTVYVFGDLANINQELTVRIHDECNGSDVFGSDICTCRPYLVHGIELCIESAQRGGVGMIVYNRKEGRALGEVTKFLVYNARKRQDGGDTADEYFKRTECVAGAQDMRFQELMPDVLLWLGVAQIDRLASMSPLKYDALRLAGISVKERIPLPEDLVPHDAKVEIAAKKASGYLKSDDEVIAPQEVKGRDFD